MPEAVKPSSMQLPLPLSLYSFLRFLLSKANVIGLKYKEAYQRKLVDIKAECLAIIEIKVEGLECQVAAKRESKEALQAKLDELKEEQTVETNKIIQECQYQVDGMNMEYLQAFEDFKKKTTENDLSYISKLKMNILLHTQVVVGPFDVHEMDLGAPKGVDRSFLGFDVSSSLSVVWESFVSTWRSSPDFYIKKDPIANEDVVPSIANNNVTHSNDVYQGIDRDNMP